MPLMLIITYWPLPFPVLSCTNFDSGRQKLEPSTNVYFPKLLIICSLGVFIFMSDVRLPPRIKWDPVCGSALHTVGMQ